MLARNSLFRRLAASADSLACCSSRECKRRVWAISRRRLKHTKDATMVTNATVTCEAAMRAASRSTRHGKISGGSVRLSKLPNRLARRGTDGTAGDTSFQPDAIRATTRKGVLHARSTQPPEGRFNRSMACTPREFTLAMNNNAPDMYPKSLLTTGERERLALSTNANANEKLRTFHIRSMVQPMFVPWDHQKAGT